VVCRCQSAFHVGLVHGCFVNPFDLIAIALVCVHCRCYLSSGWEGWFLCVVYLHAYRCTGNIWLVCGVAL
jgi:hypothetical protein